MVARQGNGEIKSTGNKLLRNKYYPFIWERNTRHTGEITFRRKKKLTVETVVELVNFVFGSRRKGNQFFLIGVQQFFLSVGDTWQVVQLVN